MINVRTTSIFRITSSLVAAVVLLIATATMAPAQLPFFPGAEGYGGAYVGSAPAGGWFSNAAVYHVTNLNDDGPGSFRNAFVENSSNKVIVFDVGGTIDLTSGKLDIKNLSNYYIAGQTAPSPVTIYGDMTQITHSNDKKNENVILRYLTFRKGTGDNSDSITFAGGSGAGDLIATNMILDHVSASWSEDEILSVANNNTNITVQYSIISDALVNNHAYGSLIRPRVSSEVSFHHNLYANNASRQPRFGTYYGETLTADFRNNVVYNWRDRASYAGGSSEPEQEYAYVNYVGNYLIAGPSTVSNVSTAFVVDKNVDLYACQSGNFIDSDRSVNPGGQPNGADTGWGMFAYSTPRTDQTLTQLGSPIAVPAVTTQTANDAYWQIINHVGNYWWSREAIDDRVINNVLSNTNPPNGVAASAPDAAELSALLSTPMTTRPAGWDSDSDAMPDVWEVAHGLNPGSGGDWYLDFDSDGYINLIEYINEIGQIPAPAPIVFNGATNDRYAQITNWKTDDGGITAGSNWQPSRFDEVQINSGTVTVDAVGQHAGVLKVGSNPGDVAALSITAGWLDVDDELSIGADDAATGSLSLSGGVLSTSTLSKGADGSFYFAGGVLHADFVEFSLTNQGGTLSPGHSIGQTSVDGNLTLSSGSLEIEIASASLADMVAVAGLVTLGGNLEVELLDGFTPSSGSWEIITATGGFTGSFAGITEGYFVAQQGNSLFLFVGSVLAGDYNGDGSVDAADYNVWRDSLGQSGSGLPADGDGSGTIDAGDYTVWKANFGATSGGGSFASAAVPEPASFALLLVGTLMFLLLRDNADRSA